MKKIKQKLSFCYSKDVKYGPNCKKINIEFRKEKNLAKNPTTLCGSLIKSFKTTVSSLVTEYWQRKQRK